MAPHENVRTFAKIYANELAVSQLYADKPVFPACSIIVREKVTSPTDLRPELLSIAVKRHAGYSPATKGWEFFVLEGDGRSVRERQTTGSCLKRHAEAKETEMVFKTYLRSSGESN